MTATAPPSSASSDDGHHSAVIGAPTGTPKAGVIRFSSDSRHLSLRGATTELLEFKGYIAYLTKRQLRTTYNRSFFGWVWSLVNPLATLAIFTIVFGYILAIDRNIEPSPTGLKSFAHFLYSALVFWQLFNITSQGTMSDFHNSVLLRKRLYFPPAAPAIAHALAKTTEAFLEVFILIAVYAFVGNLGIMVIWLPFLMLFSALFGTGVGMLLAVPNARYRDVGYLYALFLRLFFYLTPIIWPYSLIEQRISIRWLQLIAHWNPLAKMTQVSRDVTYYMVWPEWSAILYLAAWAIGMFVLGFSVFNRNAANATEGL